MSIYGHPFQPDEKKSHALLSHLWH